MWVKGIVARGMSALLQNLDGRRRSKQLVRRMEVMEGKLCGRIIPSCRFTYPFLPVCLLRHSSMTTIEQHMLYDNTIIGLRSSLRPRRHVAENE